MYVCVYVCIYIYIHARVGVHMHSCRRILFFCTVQSLYNMRVYHRCFLTPACVCVEGLEVTGFPACSWLALVAVVGGYVLAGGFVLFIFLFLQVLRWCACVCLYTRVHTHNYLGTWCEPRCGTDILRARRTMHESHFKVSKITSFRLPKIKIGNQNRFWFSWFALWKAIYW